MKSETKRRTVLSLLDSGKITAGEAVRLSGESRQLIYYWLRSDKIDWRKARKKYISKAWKKGQLKELRNI